MEIFKPGTSGLTPYVFQCQLAIDGSNLRLSRYRGTFLTINGALETIPSAGVALSTSGLSSSTTYYIYAFMSSGTMTLEASTTAPASDSTLGYKIKTGDTSRTLVGLARTSSGTAWVNSGTQRFVRTFFNDPGVGGASDFSGNPTYSSNSTGEVQTNIRVEFLSWADELVSVSYYASLSNNTNTNNNVSGIGIDGTSTTPVIVNSVQSTANAAQVHAGNGWVQNLSEGYHYTTVVALSPNSTTITFSGSYSRNYVGLRGNQTR